MKVIKKPRIIRLGLLITAVVVILTIAYQQRKPKSSETVPSPPTPTPPIKNVQPASLYATDSAILAIETALETIGVEIQETDLKEAALNPPLLDMDVNFKEK